MEFLYIFKMVFSYLSHDYTMPWKCFTFNQTFVREPTCSIIFWFQLGPASFFIFILDDGLLPICHQAITWATYCQFDFRNKFLLNSSQFVPTFLAQISHNFIWLWHAIWYVCTSNPNIHNNEHFIFLQKFEWRQLESTWNDSSIV